MVPDESIVVVAGGPSVRAASLWAQLDTEALAIAPVYDFSFPGRMIEIKFDSWARLLAANVGGRMYRLRLLGIRDRHLLDDDDKPSLPVVEAVDLRGKEVAIAWTFCEHAIIAMGIRGMPEELEAQATLDGTSASNPRLASSPPTSGAAPPMYDQ
jgi:hypothetical protein